MPRSAIAAGCVDFVLPPDAIAREIARIAQHPYVAPAVHSEDPAGDRNLKKILELLREASEVDFSYYSKNPPLILYRCKFSPQTSNGTAIEKARAGLYSKA